MVERPEARNQLCSGIGDDQKKSHMKLRVWRLESFPLEGALGIAGLHDVVTMLLAASRSGVVVGVAPRGQAATRLSKGRTCTDRPSAGLERFRVSPAEKPAASAVAQALRRALTRSG